MSKVILYAEEFLLVKNKRPQHILKKSKKKNKKDSPICKRKIRNLFGENKREIQKNKINDIIYRTQCSPRK